MPVLLAVVCVALLALGAGRAALAADAADAPPAPRYERLPELPFKPGEKIFYNIRWGIFDVGTATMEFNGPLDRDGQKVWQIVLKAETNGFADKIFKVRDYNAVWVDEAFTHPVYYVKNQKEGSTDREVIVTFDWVNNKARYSNRDEVREPINVLPDSWDPLAITYAVRNLKLDGVTHLSIPSTDGKKSTMTEIEVSGVEQVKVPAGRFDVLVLSPDTKDLGGVFKKSKDAGIKIWFTNDERHLPIKMASKVVVGSFVAEMQRIEGPGAEKYNPAPEEEQPPPAPRKRGGRRTSDAKGVTP
jgi:hypothetical protein